MGSKDLNLLLDNIRLEINNDHPDKTVTTVILDQDETEDLEHIKRNLAVEGRTFAFDKSTRQLTIDSTECNSVDDED